MIFQRKIGGPRIQHEIEKAIRNRIPPDEWEEVKDTVAAYSAPYGKGGSEKRRCIFGSLVIRRNGHQQI